MQTDWGYYRSLFPVVNDKAYFMTAGAGAIPIPVLKAITECYEKVSKKGGAVFGENIAIMESCREKLAKLINAEKDSIAFIPNVSYGVNALIHSMKNKNLFLIPRNEFPSTLLPIKNAKKNLKMIDPSHNLQNDVIAQLKFNETNEPFLIISLVSYINGYKIDIDELSQYVSNSKILLNATQGIGVFDIDVKKQKIDAMVCSCYKWLCCGEGISFLYIKPELFEKLTPIFVGWRSVQSSMSFKNDEPVYVSNARCFEIGWDNMTSFSGFNVALDLINEIGVNNISKRVTYLTSELLKLLSENNIPTLTLSDPKHISGIVLVGPFNAVDHIVKLLEKDNVFVNPRGNGIRVSLHFYNNMDDIHKLIASLKKILINLPDAILESV